MLASLAANGRQSSASSLRACTSAFGLLRQIQGFLHTATLPSPGVVQSWESSSQDVEPFSLVQQEVDAVSERLRQSVLTSIPALSTAAQYFFQRGIEGKRLRPTLVMLMASSLSTSASSEEFTSPDLRPASEYAPELRRRQQRLAEIAELIHVASLLHDDVIDDAATRRGLPSLNTVVGNKTAILAGDFLLARASVSLAALRNAPIVAVMSNVLECLVSGEIMQMTATNDQMLDLDFYLEKSYCKTASLMANSARSVAILSGHNREVCDAAWGFGRHLGLAFQIVDDILDLTSSSSILGKPAHSDLKSGISTVPVLFAAEEFPELRPLILRRFKHDGDVSRAVTMIEKSQAISRARELAAHHSLLAVESIRGLPPPETEHAAKCRAALIRIAEKVLTRKK